MKNKYNLRTILSGAILTACLAACDPLGMEPTTIVDEDRFWEDAQLSRSYVNQFYLFVPGATGDTFQMEQWSDNATGWLDTQRDTYRQIDFNLRHYDPLNTVSCFSWSNIWNDVYKRIRSANLGIERISGSQYLKENDRKQLLAECYFFRGWFYFELEKYYGGVPYVDKSLSIFDETMIPRSSREFIFDKILSDMDQATELFNESGNQSSYGMISADVATAIKSRVALYAACAAEASAKGLYGNDESGKLFAFSKPASDYYRLAFNAAGSLVGKYSLERNYEDLFTSETSYKSTESIWPVMFNKNVARFNPTGKVGVGPDNGLYYGTDKKWGAEFGAFPTEDLVECYYQKDAADGKWKQWWKTSQARDMGITAGENGTYSGTSADYRRLLYTDRDERFYATVVYDGSYLSVSDNRKDMYLIQTWIDNTTDQDELMDNSALHTGYRVTANMDAPGGRASSITGYYMRKYAHFDKYNDDGTLNREQRQTCYFHIRYAEVLLNYVEASIKLGEGDAESKLNEIRDRAGLDKFDAAVVGHDLWEEYQLQRRVEFAFEVPAQRYFDLLRWGEADGKSVIPELNRGPKTMRIFRKGQERPTDEAQAKNFKPGTPAEVGEEGYFVPKIETVILTYDNYQKKFDNARYYFVPFSESMISSYSGLVQNPGWTGFNYK